MLVKRVLDGISQNFDFGDRPLDKDYKETIHFSMESLKSIGLSGET